MKRAIYLGLLVVIAAGTSLAQTSTTFTGTAVIYGSGFNTRTITRPFTMIVNRTTPPSEASRYLDILEDRGQDALLREIDDKELGRFALGASVGLPLNAVVVDQHNGVTRIRAVFRRWIGFGELRRGYRSLDYPFGYVELLVNPRTGRGEGTFIPAARIRFREGRSGGVDTVEIEDFGTFPGRLMGVSTRGRLQL